MGGSGSSEFWIGAIVFVLIAVTIALFILVLPMFFYGMKHFIIPFFDSWYTYWQWRAL